MTSSLGPSSCWNPSGLFMSLSMKLQPQTQAAGWDSRSIILSKKHQKQYVEPQKKKGQESRNGKKLGSHCNLSNVPDSLKVWKKSERTCEKCNKFMQLYMRALFCQNYSNYRERKSIWNLQKRMNCHFRSLYFKISIFIRSSHIVKSGFI